MNSILKKIHDARNQAEKIWNVSRNFDKKAPSVYDGDTIMCASMELNSLLEDLESSYTELDAAERYVGGTFKENERIMEISSGVAIDLFLRAKIFEWEGKINQLVNSIQEIRNNRFSDIKHDLCHARDAAQKSADDIQQIILEL